MNHRFSNSLLGVCLALAIYGCNQPKQCELSDIRFVSSGQELDSESELVFYGFTFKGKTVNLIQEDGRIPVIANTSKYGRKDALLIVQIDHDTPLVISERYRIEKQSKDEDGYHYLLFFNQQGIKPYQEYPFPVVQASPGEESLVLSMIVQYRFGLDGPRKEKKLFLIGYHDRTEPGVKRTWSDQASFSYLVQSLTSGKASGVALVYKDTIVSPIGNTKAWSTEVSKQRKIIDFK